MASDRAESSQMTICFIVPKAHSLFIEDGDIQFGGAEVQLYTLAVALANKANYGVDVEAIIVDAGQPSVQCVSNVRLLASYALADVFPVRVWKMTRALMWSRASVYVQRTMTPFTPALAILLRAMRKRFVYMLASDREVEPKGFVRRILVPTALRTAAMCVHQNKSQAASLDRIGRLNAKQLPSSVPYSVPTVVPSHGERKQILWIARITPIKQAEVLLDAANDLPHVPFVIVGSPATGQEHYREQIFKAAAELPNVSVVPGVSLWETKAYYESARALVNTSAGEGMPATFVQAWAAGTPVISLSVNPDGLLSDKKLGRTCNDSVTDLVRSIEEFWHNRDLFEEYSQRSLEHARIHHDASRNAERFLRIVTNDTEGSQEDQVQ